jgi:hypothetical protein
MVVMFETRQVDFHVTVQLPSTPLATSLLFERRESIALGSSVFAHARLGTTLSQSNLSDKERRMPLP